MDDAYLIWSNEHRAWWRPKGDGYTRDLKAAGIYSRAEALDICKSSRDGWGAREIPAEIPVLLSDAQLCAGETHV